MQYQMNQHEFLWHSLSEEYSKANNRRIRAASNSINSKLKIVRIFISSTFRDFHNERDLLVTKIFPRLRNWCSRFGLHLVECDLRWGIPSDSTQEETLLSCLREIEKGRCECNDMNFFLGLIGDRYGWIPEKTQISEKIRNQYKWIEGSSVTLMEFIHGMIRPLTPNGLIMIRLSDFIDKLPDHLKGDFIETDLNTVKNLQLFKEFLRKKFEEKDILHFYNAEYEGLIYDRFIKKERVNLAVLNNFSNKIENHFIRCITENLLPYVKPVNQDNVDDVHQFLVECLVKPDTIANDTFLKLYDSLKTMSEYRGRNSNPITVLSGAAGMGKSTILAYCAKEVKKLENCTSFFHSFACTSNSMFNVTVFDRLYRFLSGEKFDDHESLEEKLTKLMVLFQNGPRRRDKDVYFIFLDGLDEMCGTESLKWIPDRTSNRIAVVISCLVNLDSHSFYLKIKNSVKYIEEISTQSMDSNQLRQMVSKYLDYFGKKLDADQMDKLMSFETSNNPLWLISACEELRIHGNYQTLTKLILSLPSSIRDLNDMVLKRLINQDSTNVLKTFLQLLVISKSGLWESLIKDLLASKLGSDLPICHSKWLDIIEQVQGFLLIESNSLPLIKLRHRVMKESILNQLAMEDHFIRSLHSKMALFFEKHLNDAGNLFFPDYIYHLIKAESRSRLLEFMRSKKSWAYLNKHFIRSKILLSMRCNNRIDHSTNQNIREFKMCGGCGNTSGYLSLHSKNKNSCFYCGNKVSEHDHDVEVSKLFPCQIHKNIQQGLIKCTLCMNPMTDTEGTQVKVCRICHILNDTCGVIVQENDILYDQQSQFSKAAYNIDVLI